MKDPKKLSDVELDIKWEGQPAGLWQRFTSFLHLNFTRYQITKDELIIKKGFFKTKTDTIELYLLKDPDMTESLLQKIIGVGNITILVDSHSESAKAGTKIVLQNVRECEKVRKLLRDAIEADVMERNITYFDKV